MPDTPEARRHDAHLARFAPKMASALIRSCEAAASAVEQGADPALAAAYVTSTAVEKVLTQLYRTVLPDEASRAYDALTEGQKAAAPPTVKESWLARATRFIRGEGALALRGLTERTRELVQGVLTEAVREGLGVQEAAARLRQEVAQVSRARAVRLVRSEIVSASNYGSLAGAESTGLKLDKYWVNSAGGRTRPSHVAAGGQTVDLQAMFVVGGFAGRFPGDPLLPPQERLNCRCSQGYKPKE